MQQPSKFCPRCRTRNYEGAMFCYSCSFKFPDAEYQSERTRRGAIFLGALAIILTLIVVCLYWALDGPRRTSPGVSGATSPSLSPIGNIQYRTSYYSETGNLVDKGGVDSPLDKKIIQKVIPPKSTRTVEINDGFTHSEAHRAYFELIDCQFVADSR